MIKVGIVGGTGYTGVELMRLLLVHPEVTLTAITSRAEVGRPVADLFPNLRGHLELSFSDPDCGSLEHCDVVFFATPHGVAQATVPGLLGKGIRVIDLSADFRIRDIPTWERWYKQSHGCPELVEKAVYGLPEMYREEIRKAQLVACPGCYPTSVQLGFLPLLEKRLIDADRLIANSASGSSGAGRQASVDNLLSELGDSFKAYGVPGHRHLPEIEQGLTDINGSAVKLTFVPHLLPIIRGIHSTLYATLKDGNEDLQQLFEERYRDEPFVDVMSAGSHPQTRSVRGSNHCRLSVFRPDRVDGQPGNTVVVLVVIDNLVKGAAGQAIQNMNLMFACQESTGLESPGMMP